MDRNSQYEYAHYDDYEDPQQANFWVPHQLEERLVQFNRLTTTIDEIVARCGYPESAREGLAVLHRRLTEEFLRDYRGPVEGPIPLLEETRSPVAG